MDDNKNNSSNNIYIYIYMYMGLTLYYSVGFLGFNNMNIWGHA